MCPPPGESRTSSRSWSRAGRRSGRGRSCQAWRTAAAKASGSPVSESGRGWGLGRAARWRRAGSRCSSGRPRGPHRMLRPGSLSAPPLRTRPLPAAGGQACARRWPRDRAGGLQRRGRGASVGLPARPEGPPARLSLASLPGRSSDRGACVDVPRRAADGRTPPPQPGLWPVARLVCPRPSAPRSRSTRPPRWRGPCSSIWHRMASGTRSPQSCRAS